MAGLGHLLCVGRAAPWAKAEATVRNLGWYNGPISDFVWFRRDMPWLGRGFIYCVDADAEPTLRQQLGDLGFVLYTLAGEAVDDARSLHAALARTFDFPDYYGSNWDAFNDCFDEPELPRRTALMWRGAERLARRDLKAFAEAIAVLRDASDTLAGDDRQLELFLLGTGSGFRRPSDPVDHAWRQHPL